MRKKEMTSDHEDVEKLEPWCIAGRNIKWYSHTVENSSALRKKIKQNYRMIQQCYKKELKAETKTDTCTPIFIATLFIIAQNKKCPNAY